MNNDVDPEKCVCGLGKHGKLCTNKISYPPKGQKIGSQDPYFCDECKNDNHNH